MAMAMCGVSSGLSWTAECRLRAGGAIYSRRCPLARSTVASALGACRGGRRKEGGRRMRSPRRSTWSAGRGQYGWRRSARVFRHQMICKSQSRPWRAPKDAREGRPHCVQRAASELLGPTEMERGGHRRLHPLFWLFSWTWTLDSNKKFNEQ